MLAKTEMGVEGWGRNITVRWQMNSEIALTKKVIMLLTL